MQFGSLVDPLSMLINLEEVYVVSGHARTKFWICRESRAVFYIAERGNVDQGEVA